MKKIWIGTIDKRGNVEHMEHKDELEVIEGLRDALHAARECLAQLSVALEALENVSKWLLEAKKCELTSTPKN